MPTVVAKSSTPTKITVAVTTAVVNQLKTKVTATQPRAVVELTGGTNPITTSTAAVVLYGVRKIAGS